ncbi:MAG: hypothetical protein SFU91_06700 [Chloroherpetonaceae bacterium]|nr:hypothetical protein [Chloroherpetonaceae bacterium]
MQGQVSDKKIELIQWLSGLEDTKVIEKLLKIKEEENQEWWDDLTRDEKASIEKGIDDAKLGKVTSHLAVKALYEKWL